MKTKVNKLLQLNARYRKFRLKGKWVASMGGKLGGKWVASFLGTGKAVFSHVKNAMRFRTCEKNEFIYVFETPCNGDA